MSEMTKTEISQKKLSYFQTLAVIVGVVIGSGVFFKPAKVYAAAGSPGMGILAWLAGGIITMAAALTLAELASAIPKTGGMFAYLKELYGESVAYLLGWVQTVIYFPGTSAALAIIFATQATFFIPMNSWGQKMLAIFIAVFLTVINIISTQLVGKIQVVFTIGKLIPIFAIIIFGFIMGTAHNYTPMVGATSTATGFGAAILGTLWAYSGWEAVCNVAGEVENPKKNLPKSLIIGISVVMVAYIGINAAIVNVMPMEAVAASPTAASDAAVILFGPVGAAIISAGILVSIFGALNGFLLVGARVPYAMGKEKLLPFADFFGKEAKSGTPVNALIVQLVLAIVYILSGSFDLLTNLVVFAIWIFFVLCLYGIFILRKKHPELTSEYKVPLYPIIPIIGIAGGLYILYSTLMTDTVNALVGLGITIAGIPIYFLIKKKK